MYIIPKPQEIEISDLDFQITYDGLIQLDKSCPMESFYHAQILQKEIKDSSGMCLNIVKGEAKKGIIKLSIENSEKEEGYSLRINDEGVFIVGASTKGLLYGIQTLRQIIRQEGTVLPNLSITDYPQIANRGFYHDITRGRVPNMDWLKSLADCLSFYKINQMQLYIEHTYLFEDLSEMWRDDTPLTAQDIMELDAYCHKLGIELVPSFSTFGHLYKLLCTKSFRHLGELPETADNPFKMHDRMHHHTINVTLDESRLLITNMIEEFMSLFSSKHFNICADETFDLGKGRSKESAEKTGITKMYIDYVKYLCNFLISKDRIPMFWGDIICGFPELIKELPKETICLNWGYAYNQTDENTKKLAEAGATQYVCPGVGCWNQFCVLLNSAYQNITRMCSYGNKYNAVGVLNTDWGDYGHINHPTFSIPGMIYGAAFSWNNEIIPYEEINRQISRIEYMDSSENFISLVGEIGIKAVFGWYEAVTYQESNEEGAIPLQSDELIERAKNNNKELQNIKRQINECLKHMDTSTKKEVLAYQIAADAVIIFNEIGIALFDNSYSIEERYLLANRLEYWFYHYKKLWQSVSRESELAQVSNIIFWYGDMLRRKV